MKKTCSNCNVYQYCSFIHSTEQYCTNWQPQKQINNNTDNVICVCNEHPQYSMFDCPLCRMGINKESIDTNNDKVSEILKPYRSEMYDCNMDECYGYYESEVYRAMEEYADVMLKEFVEWYNHKNLHRISLNRINQFKNQK